MINIKTFKSLHPIMDDTVNNWLEEMTVKYSKVKVLNYSLTRLSSSNRVYYYLQLLYEFEIKEKDTHEEPIHTKEEQIKEITLESLFEENK